MTKEKLSKKNTNYHPFPNKGMPSTFHDFANLNYTYSFEIP